MARRDQFNPELFRYDPARSYPWLVFPKTTLAIVCWNRLDMTKRLLDSLVRHTHLPHEYLIVDNASTDGTQAYLRGLIDGGLPIRLIENRRNQGRARAHMQIRDAVPDGLVVVFDNDIEVLSNYWLLHIQKAFHALRLATGSTVASFGMRLLNCEEYGFRYGSRREVLRIPAAENAAPRTSYAAVSKDAGELAQTLDEEVVIAWTEHQLGAVHALPATLFAQVPLQDEYPAFIGGTDAFMSEHLLRLGARLGYIENGPVARHNDWPYDEAKLTQYEQMVGQRAVLDRSFLRWRLRHLFGRTDK